MRRPLRSHGGSHGGDAAAGATRTPLGIAPRMVLATVALALVVGAVFVTLLLSVEDARNAQRGALHSQDTSMRPDGWGSWTSSRSTRQPRERAARSRPPGTRTASGAR